MKKALLILMTLGLLISFSNCDKDKDDDNNNNNNQTQNGRYYKLYNKWWYNLYGQARGDHYFKNTDSIKGTFEVTHPTLPDYNGNYQWYPSGDSMLIEVNGAYNVYFFNFIGDDEMNYSPANEPNNVYYFADTKP